MKSDETVRFLEIKIIGRKAVVFWADHAVKEVKILDIQNTDRV